MRPVRHAGSNVVYRGPRPDIGDLWVRRSDGVVSAVYELDDADRELLAAGGRIELGLYSEPIPPVSLVVLPEEMCRPVGEHTPWPQRVPEEEIVDHLREHGGEA